MKRTIAIAILAVLSLSLCAQPRQGHTPPPPERHTVSFESQHGESFTVYIDGDIMNRMPQTRVMINDISGQTHEVVVVMKRPADKAATLSLRPGERNVTVNVNYDNRLEQLYLYTPEHNRAQVQHYAEQQPAGSYMHHQQPPAPPSQHVPPMGIGADHVQQQVEAQQAVRPVEQDELNSMAARMKAQSFDSDRLALGKVIVASANLSAAQIAYLAQTIDFSNTQVEFLKYAYHYCIDPANYYTTVDVLTFSSDKKKVLDYIATQR